MDPVKIVIFLTAFVVLFLIGRMLSASSEVRAAQLPPSPNSYPANSTSVEDAKDYDGAGPRGPALTGAEIDFPISLPPVTQLGHGTFNRPMVRNYYFKKTDLVRGPADPDSFCDEFYIELQDPDSEHIWTEDYTVTTPTGLQQVMTGEKFDSLYLAGNVVVVARWDLRIILKTVMDEIMKGYGHTEDKPGNPPPAPSPIKISRWGHAE